MIKTTDTTTGTSDWQLVAWKDWHERDREDLATIITESLKVPGGHLYRDVLFNHQTGDLLLGSLVFVPFLEAANED